MNKLAYLILVTLIIGCSSSIADDYRKTLDSLEKQHQTELNKGERMMHLEKEYELVMDSMLNIVYKDLMLKLNETEKKNLRTEQREWIKKRDVEFKKLWKSIDEMITEIGFAPQDERMFVYSQKANFVRNRVLELVDKIEER
ncbi:hypothetical protein DF185_06745 [Marinifilum breve]|uniref:Lysozyme inhibitor LprI-like N-terminal domain-containing protein n=1 Tax=Marinifilum breve TaxID=2184082 RepID=A0A2V4A4Q0_9BACT|nr:lysozyme inhibitor LprI family protein [Marinifilum breve]PXY02340.1 hypothetical protein DF185_06745 [Marinifilum breve]